tara:strand:- start:489 stop:1961 length:1473 start_codon:yes stop_codon:yes gene_type:complete
MKTFNKILVWFNRDLRVEDNTALKKAIIKGNQVFCTYIFDNNDLRNLKLEDKKNKKISFIYGCLEDLNNNLNNLGGNIFVNSDDNLEKKLIKIVKELSIDAVFVNYDYEPYFIKLSTSLNKSLKEIGCEFESFKDLVIFEKSDILTLSSKPFSVFTPYKNAWLKKIKETDLRFYENNSSKSFLKQNKTKISYYDSIFPNLKSLGFDHSDLKFYDIETGSEGGEKQLKKFLNQIHKYHITRDFPNINGTSYLSVHIRYGTLSIRKLVSKALELSEKFEGAKIWLSELIWREFYKMILFHNPHVMTRSFKKEFDLIEWEEGQLAQNAFDAWCNGRTGFPFVDAGMKQLNTTGFMHNRLRMVTSSFLIKDLGIDWRLGEKYFSKKLFDYDLSANNGGWQWAASTGCDAQPYFRIFNPITQSQKFDQKGEFIKKYLPELINLNDKQIHSPWNVNQKDLLYAGIMLDKNYPKPIVDHNEARKKTLKRYSKIKKTS